MKRSVLIFLEDREEFEGFRKEIAEEIKADADYELLQVLDESDVKKFSEYLVKSETIVVKFDCSPGVRLAPQSWFFTDFLKLTPKPLLIVVNDSMRPRLSQLDREIFGIDFVANHQNLPRLLKQVLTEGG